MFMPLICVFVGFLVFGLLLWICKLKDDVDSLSREINALNAELSLAKRLLGPVDVSSSEIEDGGPRVVI